MPRKLKVFRTPIGFHDAYVAAPSRKAALEAWGAAGNLFARGTAEEVTDPKLTAEPLRRPGEVIRVSRGDLKAQLKALGPRRKAARRTAEPEAEEKPRPRTKPKPPPKRDKVDRAEAGLAAAREKHAKERAALEKQVDALERKLAALKARHAEETARLERQLDRAQDVYHEALEAWSG